MLAQLSGLLLATCAAPQGVSLSGHVVDQNGAPVAGARVVVACQPEIPRYEPGRAVLDATSSGADGAFELELPEEWLGWQTYRNAEFFVHSRGYRLHTASWSLEKLPIGTPLRVSLAPAEAEDLTRIRVLDQRDEPIVGAAVAPSLVRDARMGRVEIPRAVYEGAEATTDAEGWATIHWRHAALMGVHVTAGDALPVELQQRWDANEPFPEVVRIFDARPWRVEFDATVDAATVDTATVRVDNRTSAPGMEGLIHSVGHLGFEDGALCRLPLPSEDRTASAFLVVGGPEVLHLVTRHGDEPTTVRVEAGADPYEVTLTIVDGETGAPVAGAEVYLQAGTSVGVVRTDASGTATFTSSARAAFAYFVRGPDGYVDVSFPRGLNYSHPRTPDGPARVEVPPFALQPEKTVHGRVATSGGAGVPGAWIVADVQTAQGGVTRSMELATFSREGGSFVLRGVPGEARCDLVARSGAFEARGTLRGSKPLELTLEGLLPARGTLMDDAGRPLAAARVEVWKASPPRLIGGERRVALGGAEHVVTDAAGRFETPAVMRSGERYGLRWSGPTVEDGASDWAPAEELARGDTFAGAALFSRSGVLRGPDGAPLAGATLRIRSSARTVETDAEGRFELEGLRASGDAVVVALADGTRRAGVLAPSSDAEDWVLPRLFGEPGAPARHHERARELELAHGLLAEGFEAAVAAGDESLTLRAARRYARVDPAAVLARTEAGLYETSWMRDFTLSYVADALEQRSPEEALAVTTRLERGMSRALATLDAARHLAPDAEREQLALVRADARSISPPEHRVVSLARLADRLLQLGEDAVATEVLEEARAVAADLPTEEWPGYARCVLGEVLATVDLDAGLALIDGLEPAGERGRHYGNVAHRIAGTNPEAAERLLSSIDTLRGASWRSSRWRARVVFAMARADRERAERIASSDLSGYSDGMIALALEETDPDGARDALERAFERSLTNGASLTDWADRPSGVAALLPLAARLEPPRLRAWIERALSLHRPVQHDGRAGERTWMADATIAVYVAPFDPELARALVEPAVAAYGALDEQKRDYDSYGAVWAAAALVDPEWAAAEARRFGGQASGQVGQVLALPPDERDAWVQSELVQLWRPGMTDI